MFERLDRSMDLVVASWKVLRQDKELLWFPLMSTIATAIVLACFALPMFGLASIDGLARPDGSTPPIVYVVAFLFYVVEYTVIFFFNTALVGAAMIRLQGGDPTVSDGMRIARSRLMAILGYALIAALVGTILRAIQERVGLVGKIIVGLFGIGWTLATFMVVPVLAARDVGPIEAIKESASLLRDTWGENVIGQAGMGFAFGVIIIAVGFAGVFLIGAAGATQSVFLIGIAVLATIMAVAVTLLVQAALAGIYSAALYRYATEGEGSPGFDADTLKLAFAPKE